MVNNLEQSQAQFLSSVMYSTSPIASVVAPIVTTQAALSVTEDVKQIIPALGNLTAEVGIFNSKVDEHQDVIFSSLVDSLGRLFTLRTKASKIKVDRSANTITIVSLQQSGDKHVVDVQSYLSSQDALSKKIFSLLQQA
ncbi:hypothetical protein L6452_22601 [Arctium lappa]|uniref:Uncharacterized protein n=1 Tax=Arctium lappa TaxID=4217 RepID=A0ACB9B4L5_ARCLA|nr:hypothetical protein L6452_22601 [Arctium lappa]